MNNTTNPSGAIFESSQIGGFSYGLGVSVGILLLITTITLASYYCARSPTTSQSQPETGESVQPAAAAAAVEPGLDEATLLSYPKLLYSQAKLRNRDTTASCCSICLADYKDSHVLRMLPDCGHLFHLKCVDAWLRMHPSCPMCRTSPLPSPMATPLAEVVPLAHQV